MTIDKDQFVEALNRSLDGRGRVYVLRLEQDWYYVGWTEQLPHRLFQHFNGRGSAMTKAFPPIEVVDVVVGGKDKEREVVARYLEQGYAVKGGHDCCVPQ